MIQFISKLKYLTNPKVLGAIALVALGGYFWYLNQQIDNRDNQIIKHEQTIEQQEQLISTLRTSNNELARSLDQYKEDFSEQVLRLNQLREQNSRLNQELRQRVSELERAKGRQDIVWQRPTLVERMLQRSWLEFVDEISCESGAKEKCKD